jgi:hypothetical protein
MTDKTHNGWTNYATWRVNIEIFDDADKAELFDLTLDAWDLGHVLRDYVEGHIYAIQARGGDEDNIAVDYALAFLSDVNWREIAKHMIDDAQLEKSDE